MFEGIIKINVPLNVFCENSHLSLLVWDGSVDKEGYTVAKECYECGQQATHHKGWIFIDE